MDPNMPLLTITGGRGELLSKIRKSKNSLFNKTSHLTGPYPQRVVNHFFKNHFSLFLSKKMTQTFLVAFDPLIGGGLAQKSVTHLKKNSHPTRVGSVTRVKQCYGPKRTTLM